LVVPRIVPSLLLITALLLPLPATASDALTLSDALRVAGEANENILAARAEVSGRERELTAARRLGWPKVDFTAKTVRIDAPISIDLSPIRSVITMLHPQAAPLIPPFRLDVQEESFQRVALAAGMPLYTGGRIAAAQRAAGERVREANELERAAAASTSSEVVQRYFAVVLAERAAAVQRDVVAAIEEHLRHAQRLEEEGLIAHAETLHAAVARTDAQRALVKAEGDARLAREALSATLAAKRIDSTLTTPLFILEELPQRLTAPDLAGNPNLLRAAALRAQAAAGTAAEAASRKPQLALAASRELDESGLTVLDPTWSVGVGLSLTLFDGGREARIAASRTREERAELLERKARRDLSTLHESRVIAMRNSQEQFRLADAAIELAQENLRVRTRAFEEGFGTSLDVVDARLALARIELARLAAASDFDNALAQLLEVRGESAHLLELMAGAHEVI
jgi:outer membrane protein TolC